MQPKIFQVCLLCLISLAVSLPAQPDGFVRKKTVQPSRRLARVPVTQRRAAPRPPVPAREKYSDEYEDSDVAASNSFGAYDDTHSQFEKGIQSQADSYSTDKVKHFTSYSKLISSTWRKSTF